jgi:hypothetical protein
MKLSGYAALVSALVAVAACQPKVEPQTGPSEADAAAALERIMAVQPCEDSALIQDRSQQFSADSCRINTASGEAASNVQMLVSFGEIDPQDENATGTIKVEVADLTGKSYQVIEETGLYQYLYPTASDFDGDGKIDLLFSREFGNVNTVLALWLQRGDWTFVRAGEMSGIDMKMRPDGLVVATGSSTAASYFIDFFTLESDKLRRVANANVLAEDVEMVGENVNVKSTVCTANIREGSPLTAETLCAQPEVKELYGDVEQRIIVPEVGSGFVWE